MAASCSEIGSGGSDSEAAVLVNVKLGGRAEVRERGARRDKEGRGSRTTTLKKKKKYSSMSWLVS